MVLALGWVERVGLDTRLDHINWVHAKPESDTCGTAGHNRRRRRQLSTWFVVTLHKALHHIFVGEELLAKTHIDTHAVGFTERCREESAENSANPMLAGNAG